MRQGADGTQRFDGLPPWRAGPVALTGSARAVALLNRAAADSLAGGVQKRLPVI